MKSSDLAVGRQYVCLSDIFPEFLGLMLSVVDIQQDGASFLASNGAPLLIPNAGLGLFATRLIQLEQPYMVPGRLYKCIKDESFDGNVLLIKDMKYECLGIHGDENVDGFGIHCEYGMNAILGNDVSTKYFVMDCHAKTPDREKFPHKCQKCGAPAYIGFSIVECSAGCGA